MSQPRAILRAVASHLPERVVTNEELAERLGIADPEEIFRNTGIRERRVAAEGECASDLATAAAKKLFDSGAARPEEIDFILFCTQTPDYYLPTTACLIQERLGLPREAGATDIAQGCAGYVIGLSLIKGLIESGQSRGALLLTGDAITKLTNPRDRSVATLFGDGGTATFLSSSGAGGRLGVTIFGTDGRGAPALITPAGAARKPRTAETARERTDAAGNPRSEDNLYMDGKEIFRFSISVVPKAFQALLNKAGWTAEDVDQIVLHQANGFMLGELVKRLKVRPDKVPYCFERTGNTTSSTIPIVIQSLLREGRMEPGARMVMLGFGVGLSWAGCTAEW